MVCRTSVTPRRPNSLTVAVSLSWIVGMLAGILFATAIELPLLHSANYTSPSFFGILISSFVPVALTVTFAVLGCKALLLATVFLKAVIHSLLFCALVLQETSPVRFVFSQGCSCLLMLFACLWLSRVPARRRCMCAVCVVAADLVICLIDYYLY